jgi:hypothetical protein
MKEWDWDSVLFGLLVFCVAAALICGQIVHLIEIWQRPQ